MAMIVRAAHWQQDHPPLRGNLAELLPGVVALEVRLVPRLVHPVVVHGISSPCPPSPCPFVPSPLWPSRLGRAHLAHDPLDGLLQRSHELLYVGLGENVGRADLDVIPGHAVDQTAHPGHHDHPFL